MKKLINILIISSLFLSCNAVTKHKDKELNKSETNYKINGKLSVESSILNKALSTKIEKYSEKESVSISDNSSIISNDITLDEGEITTTDKQGNTTSIKGKNISTKNNKSEQSFTYDYKKEIEKINELSEYKIDSAINKIDSTYEAKYEQSHKELKTTYDKKTNRFSLVLILVSALVLLVYAILKRHKIV